MPLQELKEFNHVDLFPRWADGVNQICRTLKYHAAGEKDLPEGKTLDLLAVGGGGDEPIKIPHSKRHRRRRSRASRVGQQPYHYEVGLVDLEESIRTMGRIARGLNTVQSSFHFTCKRLAVPRQALTTIDGLPQVYIPRLPQSFYKRIGTLDADSVICLTRRLLAGEDKQTLYYNYLADKSPVDPRFLFISHSGLDEYAQEAGVTLDTAIAYLITAQIVIFFFDLGYDVDFGYHTQTRNCPMDFTQTILS